MKRYESQIVRLQRKQERRIYVGLIHDINTMGKALKYDLTEHEKRLISAITIQLRCRLDPVFLAETIATYRKYDHNLINLDELNK